MIQVIVGGYKDLLNNAATEYSWVTGGSTWHPTESTKRMLVSTPGTIENLIVKLDGVAGAGKTWTFTLMLNGAPTALTCSIAGDTDTEGSDTTNTVSVSPGDGICIRATSSGTPTNRNATWSLEFSGDTAKESLLLGYGDAQSNGQRFNGIVGVFSSSLDEPWVNQVIPTPGKIKNLYVEMSVAPGAGAQAYRYTLMVNGAPSALTTTITGAATTGNDTSHEVVVAAGDLVSLSAEPLNSPIAVAILSYGMAFVADIDGESCILGGTFGDPGGVRYQPVTSTTLTWTATEINARQLVRDCFLKKFYVKVETAPGGGDSRDMIVRKNEADTDLAVNVAGSDTTGNDIADTVEFSAFDYVTIKHIPNGSPAGTAAGIHWGMVLTTVSVTPLSQAHIIG